MILYLKGISGYMQIKTVFLNLVWKDSDKTDRLRKKNCVKRPLKNNKTKFLMANGSLMQIESIAECSDTFDLH